jgi:hypothetical protein
MPQTDPDLEPNDNFLLPPPLSSPRESVNGSSQYISFDDWPLFNTEDSSADFDFSALPGFVPDVGSPKRQKPEAQANTSAQDGGGNCASEDLSKYVFMLVDSYPD